jgi:hypothetical protein
MVLGSFGILEGPEHDVQEITTEVLEVPEWAAVAAAAWTSYQERSCGAGIGAADTAEVGIHCKEPLKVVPQADSLTQDEYFCSTNLVFQVMAESAA